MHIESTTTFYQGLHDTSLMEAIAAPQVCYRHCYTSFPFPGATNGGTFTGAGQSLTRDLCRHRVSADLQAIVPQRCLYHRLTRLLDVAR